MPKHHHKSKDKEPGRGNVNPPTYPTAWSSWIKHPETDSYYSWRTDVNGQTEYCYQDRPSTSSASTSSGYGYPGPDQSSVASSVTAQTLGYHSSSTNPGSASTSNGNVIYPQTTGFPSQSYVQPFTTYGLSNSNTIQAAFTPKTAYNPQNEYTSTTYPGQANLYQLSQNTSAVDSLTQRFASTNLLNNPSGNQREATDEAYRNTPTYNPGLGSAAGYSSENAKMLDPYFKFHDSNFFKVGRVIKVLWTEPRGPASHTSVTVPNSSEPQIFTKLRRFVVIRKGRGHSLCLPILTYQHQATKKYGVVADEHVAVYIRSSGGLSVVPGEQLSKAPIEIIAVNPREKLDPMSRLHLVKIYTVEHNLKVANIGEVASSDVDRLKKYVQNTWTWEDWP